MAEKLFVISNSHLDPVWLWRRRSGRSAWVNTMHSVVRMMNRHPELKFTCSSSATPMARGERTLSVPGDRPVYRSGTLGDRRRLGGSVRCDHFRNRTAYPPGD